MWPRSPLYRAVCLGSGRGRGISPQQGFYTFANYGSSQQPHEFGQLSQDEVVPETQPTTNAGPSTQPKQMRNNKKKQVGDTVPVVGGLSRLEKWSPEKEFQLTKVWIDVSEDPIVGNYFLFRIPTVQPSASKRSKAPSTDSPGTSDARVHINLNELDEEEDDEIEDLTRPIGRDRAKTDRARARRDSSSPTTPDYNQGIEHLSQRIGDFNELKRERQRLVELQLLFTNTEHLTGVDREIAEREKDKIRNKYRDN
ncbi:hypothetical protein R6Q57_020054 [Mikania cordata]